MRRVGSTFKVIGAFNPLGNFFPARVYPVFKVQSSHVKPDRVYMQICDAQGVVQDFQEVANVKEKVIPIEPSATKFIGVDQQAIYGFSFSKQSVVFVKGLTEYCELIRRFATEERRRHVTARPLCGVEISRLIGDEVLESVYSSLAVKDLAKYGHDVARGWLKNAPLSDRARTRGERSLRRIENSIATRDENEDTIISVAISGHTYAQGHFVDLLNDGRAVVDIGKKKIAGWPMWNNERIALAHLDINLIEELLFTSSPLQQKKFSYIVGRSTRSFPPRSAWDY